ncbi:MAG: TIGR03936 family radical SAM-associated protein [Actinomycetota bacterium]|nr:TIGR03936 family radical SAM-associated protein [Actinomycetota bacterium]MCL6093053.1 TIGR03936 family radical SAM-associated protein [Actinomycetota bacterium]MDA8167382.1 TIGR03936 family radical SAM-associated protein [Actinomycetota bacterium]
MNFNYQMRFAKTGRARFIAHLDTLSLLVRAVRRTGYELAFTGGMRPKPILSLAMPLGVGVEGEDEMCDFSLKQRVPLTEFAQKLQRQLPEGIRLTALAPSLDRSKSAARVISVSYRINVADAAGWADAAARFSSEPSLVVLRRRPKGDKDVDVKKYVDKVTIGARGVEFDMKVTAEGTARPEEVVELLERFAGRQMTQPRVVRTGIVLAEEKKPGRPPGPGRGRPRRR